MCGGQALGAPLAFVAWLAVTRSVPTSILVSWAGQYVGACVGSVIDFRLNPPLPTEGYCEQCGYNLFGLIEHRCPECGMPFNTPLQSLASSGRVALDFPTGIDQKGIE
jgi:hypothetical protein